MPKISIVTTLYQSGEYIHRFYNRLLPALKIISNDYEIIFVDDGSTDNSCNIVKELIILDPLVTLIKLSKNFGHHHAMLAGLKYSSGDYVFLIDVDLEEDPSMIKTFYDELIAAKVDMVYGTQNKRKGGLFERASGYVFYKLMELFSGGKIPTNVMTIRIMTRRYINALKNFNEKIVFLHGVLANIGFKQKAILIDKAKKGTTTYTLKRKFKLAVDAITSFSSRPLYLIFILGLFLSLVSFFIATYFFLLKMLYNVQVSGWSTIVVSIWFLFSLMFLFLGIIGVYISKIFVEVKNSPAVIIEELVNYNHNQIKDD